MWVVDAVLYVVRGLDDRAILAPSALVILAWLLWLWGPRTVRSFRTRCLLAGLFCATIAVSSHLALIAWWAVIYPWLNPHSVYCASSTWVDLVTFLGTAWSFILSLVGFGPGSFLTFLAATLLLVLRVSMW